ncbi:hypothetical protein NQ315_013478 [Exocentrus adspersus]|uniref:RNA-directed DNA polymerase n=1 Tax=Exocentrus adspersus TaxID=1586481 RepID=A0AAV8VEA5_9CUCU|nr:hypothetical protein NQ315_013478 [Exocentrus adspersus]
MRETTLCANRVKRNNATKYGTDNEPLARAQFKQEYDVKVITCGLFVDKQYCMLAASPDGLVGNDGLIEIKCPKVSSDMHPKNAIQTKVIKCCTIDENNLLSLKENHDYYYQIQGQLHVTQRSYCYFIIWSPIGMLVQKANDVSELNSVATLSAVSRSRFRDEKLGALSSPSAENQAFLRSIFFGTVTKILVGVTTEVEPHEDTMQVFSITNGTRPLLQINTKIITSKKDIRFKVVHIAGKHNELPDFLSRNPETEAAEDHPVEDRNMYDVQILDEEPDPRQGRNTLFERVLDGQEDDEECRADRQRLLHVQLNGPQNDNERRVAAQYFVENGKLWKRKSDVQRALVVPTQLRDLVLDEYHDSVLAAHPGRDETLTAIQRAYFWQDMQRDVGDYVQSCLVCASTKRGAIQTKAPLRPRIPTQPGHTWSIDVLGPYPQTVRTKKEYILVAVDLFTKWVEAEAVLRATHVEVIAFVDSIAARFGYPAVIITDNGGVFRSAQWERYLQEKHVEAYFAPIYHQRANPVERRVQELKKVLRVNRVETHRWDQHLSEALFSLRTRKNAATGQTASELVYGENLKRPGEWTIPPEVVPPQERNQEIRRQRLQQARRRQEVYARNLFPEPMEAGTEFAPGSQVLTRVWTKPADGNPFHATWTGPHQVITRHGNNTYTVERDGLQVRIHVDDLRPPPPARGNAAHPQE